MRASSAFAASRLHERRRTRKASACARGRRISMRRRDVLRLGLAAGGAGVLAARGASAQEKEKDLLKFLCPPDGFPAPLSRPSPKAQPFVAELFVPPVKQPVAKPLDPPPDPRAHQ